MCFNIFGFCLFAFLYSILIPSCLSLFSLTLSLFRRISAIKMEKNLKVRGGNSTQYVPAGPRYSRPVGISNRSPLLPNVWVLNKHSSAWLLNDGQDPKPDGCSLWIENLWRIFYSFLKSVVKLTKKKQVPYWLAGDEEILEGSWKERVLCENVSKPTCRKLYISELEDIEIYCLLV